MLKARERDVHATATVSRPPNRRINGPHNSPDKRIQNLVRNGWSYDQIADRIGASSRAVYRWAAGDSEPLPVFDRLITELSA